MTKDHILEIRNFYMKLLEAPNLKDSIFHQAHCEEMVALCNYATRPEGGAQEQCDKAIALLGLLAETPPIQRWKEYEERGEQRIPCYIQVETAQAIAEFFSEPPMNSDGVKE